MKNIFIIFICIALVSCQTITYNKEFINSSSNIAETYLKNDGIIIFEEFIHGVYFKNINDTRANISPINQHIDGKSDLQVLKVKSGKYFLAEGIFDKGSPKMCLLWAGAAFILISLTLGLLTPYEGFRSVPSINDNLAVIYFDIKPGEVIYVGSLNSSNLNCSFLIEDNFNDIKEKLSKTMPSIANIMQKKLMKLEKMPEVCEDLTNEWSRDINHNKPMKKIDLYQNYPACIKALENLGQETVVNNNV